MSDRATGLRLLAAILAASLAPTAGAAGAAELQPPPGERPLRISIGFTVIDFARVNGREESFDLHGLLRLRWVDPRLAAPEGDGKLRRLPSAEVWTPHLVALNSLEDVSLTKEGHVWVDDAGTVDFDIAVAGKFATPMDLRRFPFDSQTLRLLIQPAENDRREIVLVADGPRSRVLPDAFLSDWDILAGSGEVEDHRFDPDPEVYSRYIFRAGIARRSTFYVWRVLLPMTLLVAVSWAIFWFDVTQLQPQISTALGVLLSLVVFNFNADFGQPRSPYLTLLDRHAVIAFASMVAAIVAVAVLHQRLQRRGADAASDWQRRCRSMFPAAYAAAVVAEFLLP